jgi:predicted CXXCH cytochrome family protein
MGQKEYVHGVGVSGLHCIKCHEVVRENEHTFQLPEKAVDLCAQCHSGQYIAPSDVKGAPPEIIASTDVFEEGKMSRFHKPFVEGKCTACHDAHESDNYLHLKRPYPKGLYAVFSVEAYSLCLSCHKELEEVLTEPRTLTATKFRNGNLNLHYRHVNKKKGRSCKVCHHPHGSENPKLLKDNFMFGVRKLSVNYKKTDTGGSCAPTCHVSLKYDRSNPYDVLMIVSPRPGKDATQQELNESMNRDLTQKEQKEQEKEQAETGDTNEARQNK